MKKYLIYLGIAICLIVLLILFKSQLKNNLTYLILLLCPLMHIFMMKGMHNNHPAPTNKDGKEEPDKTKSSCH